ncbi:MAG: hypothetical protein QM644_06315 [Mobilitalea sp.]
MKKLLRKIIVLVCVATLFVMPASTVLAATSTPVLKFSTSTAKYFEYEPTPYVLTANISTGLDDIYASEGNWYCPAFKNFNLVYTLATSSSYRITILRIEAGSSQFTVVSNSTYTGIGGSIQLGQYAGDASYKVLITGITTTHIVSYGGYYE